MLTQIKILTKLELCNLYGRNVFRFSKDRKARKKSLGLLAIWVLLLALLVFYVGGLAYGLICLGLEAVVPAYLITISSVLIFVLVCSKQGVSSSERKDMTSYVRCRFPRAQSLSAACCPCMWKSCCWPWRCCCLVWRYMHGTSAQALVFILRGCWG